jgi:ribosomal protein L37AE/L43A
MLIHLWEVSKCVFKRAATFLWKIVKCGQKQKQLNMFVHKEDGTTEEEKMAKEMDQYDEDGTIEGEQIGVR